MRFKNSTAEQMRLRAFYKRLAMQGRLNLPVDALRALLGPDCAYHLYWCAHTKDSLSERLATNDKDSR